MRAYRARTIVCTIWPRALEGCARWLCFEYKLCGAVRSVPGGRLGTPLKDLWKVPLRVFFVFLQPGSDSLIRSICLSLNQSIAADGR